jgi:hypothetical protein
MERRVAYRIIGAEVVEGPTDEAGLSYPKRVELWRQFTAHLIGLATVLWWVWFKEAPPK